MSERNVCLDLFAGLGGFSAAFEDIGTWEVVTVELEEKFEPDIQANVMDLRPFNLPDADVVLAGVPCIDFSMACMDQKWDSDEGRNPRYMPKTPDVAKSVSLVYRTLWIINELNPDYWYLENPATGMLRHIIGRPTGVVHYCQYGKDYKKPTGLWGEHAPMEYCRCSSRDKCGHAYNTDGDHGGLGSFSVGGPDSANRAKVPYELSASILQAIETAYDQPPREQSTLV